MFKINQLWRKTVDHPLGKAQDRQKLMGELATEDPYKALQEINFWLESVRDTDAFELSDRITVVRLLDETGQSFKKKLSADYLAAAVRMQKNQEHRLWGVINDFSRRGYEAYIQCLERLKQTSVRAELTRQQPTIMVRSLRALAEQKKWLHMRYRTIDESLWREIATLTLLAEAERAARSLLTAYPAENFTTSVLSELVKALMLDVSSPNSLTPRKLEITNRLLVNLAGAFEMTESRVANSVFYFDLSTSKPPARIPENLEPSSTTFYFSAGEAVQKLQIISEVLQQKGKQPDMDFAENVSTLELLETVRHLMVYWAPTSPQRLYERTQDISRFHVLNSYLEIHKHIANNKKKGNPVQTENKDILYMERVDLKLYGFVTEKTKKHMLEAAQKADQEEESDEKTETWTMENKSVGGFGAVIPQLQEDWVKVGALVAVKRQEEKQWLVGIIRRMVRDAELKVLVGIQAISPQPAVAVELRSLVDAQRLSGLLLVGDAQEQTLLLATGSFTKHKIFELWANQSKQKINLLKVLERGDDFEYIKYQLDSSS